MTLPAKITAATILHLRRSLAPTKEELKIRSEAKTRFPHDGISQSELARRIGVSTRTVQSWEQGRRVSGPACVVFETWAKNLQEAVG